MLAKPVPIESVRVDAFAARQQVDDETGCWEWLGGLDRYGYGNFRIRASKYKAHRIAYVLAGCQLGLDQVIDHLCRNRACVNPEHMEATTVQVNVARGRGPTAAAAAARVNGLCINGHVIATVGTHRQQTYQTCGQCGRDRVARYQRRRGAP